MNNILFISVKMPTSVGILTIIDRIRVLKPEKISIVPHNIFMSNLNFMLNWAIL